MEPSAGAAIRTLVERARRESPAGRGLRNRRPGGGVGSLPSRVGGFDSVTPSLALNFFPEPASAIEITTRFSGFEEY